MAYLTDLADALRAAGLNVVELPNWKTRGRPTGSFNPIGVLCHHTGGSSDSREYVEWMAYTGRSDLPAPLCQLSLSRNGTVYVCAAGRSNHGGVARATGPMPAGDANTLYIGIEAMNTGSEGWSKAQYDAYVRLCAALCSHYEWPASHVRAHRETSVTGKWDPGLLNMDTFRLDVARAINDLEDDDMTPDDRKLLEETRAAVADLHKRFNDFAKFERERDQKDRERARKRHDILAALLTGDTDEPEVPTPGKA